MVRQEKYDWQLVAGYAWENMNRLGDLKLRV